MKVFSLFCLLMRFHRVVKMCIVAADAPEAACQLPSSSKRPNPADERKEKSRDAARERRAKEFEYFQVQKFNQSIPG